MKRKIAITYASIGSGHMTVAKAIKQILSINKNLEIVLFDIVKYSKIDISKVNSINLRSGILGFIYDVLWDKRIAQIDMQKFKGLVLENFNDYLKTVQNFNADLIINTHALSGLLLKLHKESNISLAVITDYYINSIWLLTKYEKYIVPNIITKTAITNTTQNANVNILGIPLRKEFYTLRKKIKVVHNINRIFILLGGIEKLEYFNKDNKLISNIKKISNDYKVTIVCGSDNNLFNQIKQIQSKNIKVFSITNNIAKHIFESDLVVCKPGGLITSESSYLGKPMIFITKGYGQEKYNQRYFETNNCALYCEIEKLYETIKNLDDKTLKLMSNSCINTTKNNDKRNIYKTIINTMIKN